VAQFAAFIPLIISAAGTLIQGSSAKQQGEAAGLQMEHVAGQERAGSQRVSAERRKSARYLASRAKALAAASGATADDPTVTNILNDIDAEGEYGALAAMYEGEERARGLEYGAKIARKQGQAAMTSSTISAGSTILAGGSSWYDKYGGGGAPGTVRGASGTARSDYERRYGINSPRYG
jgi:hypothetical protein